MTNFKKDNYVCVVPRDQYEPYEWYLVRGHFVASQKPETLEQYNETVRLSRIFKNIKFQKCSYNQVLMKQIKEMEDNMFST